MEEKTSKSSTTGQEREGNSSPEFAQFLKEMGVRALDRFATKVAARDEDEPKEPKGIRKIADHWLDLEEAQKKHFFDQMLVAAQAVAAAAPGVIAGIAARRAAKAAEKEAKGKSKSKSKKSSAKKASAASSSEAAAPKKKAGKKAAGEKTASKKR